MLVAIYGSAIKNREVFRKNDFQEIGENEPGITAEKDPEVHRQIAKQLVPAFSTKSLRKQEDVIHQHVDGFVTQLRKHAMTDDVIEMKQVWFLGSCNTGQRLTFPPSGSTGSSLILRATWRMVDSLSKSKTVCHQRRASRVRRVPSLFLTRSLS